jgi:3D (Asp-Asp-Asp) domain-containing protein
LKLSRLVAAALTASSVLVVSTAFAQEVGAPAADRQTMQAMVTGYVGGMTASGVATHWGTVAADWRLYPPGTRLQIEGFPDDVFTVEDSGSAVRGNVFDVWFPDLATAVAFGTKSLQVTVLVASP